MNNQTIWMHHLLGIYVCTISKRPTSVADHMAAKVVVFQLTSAKEGPYMGKSGEATRVALQEELGMCVLLQGGQGEEITKIVIKASSPEEKTQIGVALSQNFVVGSTVERRLTMQEHLAFKSHAEMLLKTGNDAARGSAEGDVSDNVVLFLDRPKMGCPKKIVDMMKEQNDKDLRQEFVELLGNDKINVSIVGGGIRLKFREKMQDEETKEVKECLESCFDVRQQTKDEKKALAEKFSTQQNTLKRGLEPNQLANLIQAHGIGKKFAKRGVNAVVRGQEYIEMQAGVLEKKELNDD